MLEYLKLIGIIIIVAGFVFKVDILATVVVSAIVTGMISGMSILEVLNLLGGSFVSSRSVSIFIISFPVIAIIERYGLKEQATKLIRKIKGATAGRILSIYAVIRTIAAALSIRISGHVQFIRPLILPMSLALGEKSKGAKLSEKQDEDIRGHAAAVENYANFFGQNLFFGSSGVLLIQDTLVKNGYDVTLQSIALNAVFIAVAALIISTVQFTLLDKKVKKAESTKPGNTKLKTTKKEEEK